MVGVSVLREGDKKAMILTSMARSGPRTKKLKKINVLKVLCFLREILDG
jgi:hypothetical protein